MNSICHLFTRSSVFIIIFLIGISLCSSAQIYEPDGLRMPGTWNSWQNDPGMGGNFDLVKQHSGTPRWTTTFQYTGTTGSNAFKFVSTSFGDPWGNQWAGNTVVGLNTTENFIFGTPSDPDNSIQLTGNKWYTVVFEDLGYVNSRAVFMETSAQPVTISQVIQHPVVVGSADVVEIEASLSSSPSPEEKFYLRYTTDGWVTNTVTPMVVSGTLISGGIPAQNSQTSVSYYLFSSVFMNPQSDYDLLTLRLDNNFGANYSYVVDQVIECGGQLSLITADPAFPIENQSLTIYFNAAYGNGGLFDYTGDVYAHTGVITNLSVNSSDWKYVKTEWGENTPESMLTRISENLYSLTISNIRDFYGVPVSEQISKMAFVFRSGEEQTGGYYLEHKNADGSDIFLDVYPPALNVKILNPSRREPLVSPNSLIPVCVEALQNNQISLYLDGTLLTQETGTSLSYPLLLQGMQPGAHWIKAIAGGTSGQARDSVQIYLRGPVVVEELPQGMKNGINYMDENTVTLVLHDPAGMKNFAFVIGEFSNWLPDDAGFMKRTPDGKHYWVTLSGLETGKEYAYQYFIDGSIKIADAWCEKILDPWNDRWIPTASYPDLKPYPFDQTLGVVSVFQTNKPEYDWQVDDFTPPAIHGTQSDLFIYELLVRDFTDERNMGSVEEKLDYLQGLGVNAVELMPVIEFDGNESWGYAPNFYFATDKYYGTEQAYKHFIDACHQRNIAVIFDIVPNHAYGLNPMVQMYFDPNAGTSGQPSAVNPWFNQQATHPYSIGYDFNHESPYTRQFFKDVFEHWITNYKVDGFRLDLSKGLTQHFTGEDVGAWSQYDQSRINILTDYYTHIKSVNPDVFVILEHLASNDEEVVLANTGMLPWSAMHDHYKQVGMGWQENSDLSWAYHANRGFTYPNLIDYMENHDEERLMAEDYSYGASSGNYNLRDTSDALHHMQAAAVLFMGIPGPKMSWQFGELGYDYSIMYNGGRTANKPPRWDYFNQPARQELYRVYSGMAALRKSDAFRYGSYTSDLGGLGKRMWISHSSMNVVIAANSGVSGFDMAPGFPNAGKWYDYFSGDEVNVTNPSGQSFYFGPGEYIVFTSIQLPRPYYHIQVTVTDSISGAAIGNAMVSIVNSGQQSSNGEGKAGFTAAPSTVMLTSLCEGYRPYSKSLTVGSDLAVQVKLQVAGNAGIHDNDLMKMISVLPNPSNGQVKVKAPALYLVTCYSPSGSVLFSRQMSALTEDFDLSGMPRGILLFRFSDETASFVTKVVNW